MTFSLNFACVALAAMLVSGCFSSRRAHSSQRAGYRPGNVYRAVQKFPSDIRRIAVLPVSVASPDWQAEAGLIEVEPVLHAELGKLKAFELVMVAPDQMRRWTGKASWTAEEKLPADLFDHLQEGLGCDAALFSYLRPYHAYKPLVVGWNFKLVGAKAKGILWSADEVFDASEPIVARAAEEYCREHFKSPGSLGDSSSILISPRRFSQFTLSAMLGTIPER